MRPPPYWSRTVIVSVLALAGVRAQARGELLDRVAEVLAGRFHDRAFARERLPDLVAVYRPQASAARDLREEAAVVHGFLAQVPASHLALYSRTTQRGLLDELANRTAATLGCEVVAAGGSFFVHDVVEGGPAAQAGVLRGDRLAALDGVAPGTSRLLDWRCDDAALPDPPVHRILVAEGQEVRLRVERRPGEVHEVLVRAAPYSGLQAARASQRVEERGGRRIGVLRIRFMHATGLPELLRAALRGPFAGVDGVVLDIRGRGGSAFTVAALLRVLEDPGLPQAPVALVVDQGTRSAKEAFAYEVRKRRLGVLVGERTAGAVLPASFADVGQGFVLMYPASSLGTWTREIEGVGVEPDVPARDALAFAAGADPLLERALEVLATGTR